ncbi:MAG: FAD-binding protein [Verrucomicrobia bacterium]|nr:FAD-binding protein [Verrucomicrobiota bacterium]
MSPTTPEELAAAVRALPRVLPVGAGTKARLAAVAPGVTPVSTRALRGIVEYEPDEFTFTARAGTPLAELAAVLAERGQYLPFDPPLATAGATLGGTVAAGLSGPGRWRFGGVRDFILGARFVDGEGRLLRVGGKVVKNAAGFDLPKFFVGSAGCCGVLAELTFKVFPRPAATRTLRLTARDAADQVRLLRVCAGGRWELDALEAAVDEPAVFVRLGAEEAALGPLVAELLGRFPGRELVTAEAAELWTTVTGFGWAHPGGALAKVLLTSGEVPAFVTWVRAQAGARAWIGAGGNAGYVSLPPARPVAVSPWAGALLRGNGPRWLGPRRTAAVMAAVKRALDPAGRFPDFED